MKASADRADILAALEKCAHASGDASGRAHGGKVRLTASAASADIGDVLHFYANDLTLSIDTAVTAQVAADGAAAVDTKRLHAVVAALPEGPVLLGLTGKTQQLSVTAKGNRKYALPTVDAETFPTPFQPPDDAPRLVVPAKRLSYLLSRVAHAMSPEKDGQPHLQGIRLEVLDGHAFAVALDNKRFAKAETDLPGVANTELFVPRSMVRFILANYADGELTLGNLGSMIFVDTVDTMVSSLMPASGFPPWQRLLGSLVSEPVARVPRVMLLETVKAVLAARTSASDLILGFADPYDFLELRLGKTDAEARDRLAVTNGHSQPFELLYDPNYILDAVRAAEADLNVGIVQTGGEMSALIFETDDKFVAWIAPRRP